MTTTAKKDPRALIHMLPSLSKPVMLTEEKALSRYNNLNRLFRATILKMAIITGMRIYYVQYWHYSRSLMKVAWNLSREILRENSLAKSKDNEE